MRGVHPHAGGLGHNHGYWWELAPAFRSPMWVFCWRLEIELRKHHGRQLTDMPQAGHSWWVSFSSPGSQLFRTQKCTVMDAVWRWGTCLIRVVTAGQGEGSSLKRQGHGERMTSLKCAFSTYPLSQGAAGSYSEAPKIGWILMEMAIHPRISNDLATCGTSHYTFVLISL